MMLFSRPKCARRFELAITMPDLDEFMTTQEAAKKLRLHIVTVRNLVRTKKLEGLKIGGKTWLVSKRSVEDYRIGTEGMSKNDPRRRKQT